VAQVEAGSKLVHQAGKTMDEVVASVKQVSDIVAEITSASQEQKPASSRSTRPSPRWTQ
jgi:methyl-accepting chemotaxis protein